MDRRFGMALAAAALVWGCGPASIDGEVGGQSLDTSDAIANQWTTLGTNGLTIVIGGSTSNLCKDASDGTRRKGSSYTTLTIGKRGPLTTGDYAIGGIPILDQQFASAGASVMDDACGDTLKKSAGGGKITLEKMDGTTFSGTFDLAFGPDIVKGSFSATLCGSDLKTDVTSCL